MKVLPLGTEISRPMREPIRIASSTRYLLNRRCLTCGSEWTGAPPVCRGCQHYEMRIARIKSRIRLWLCLTLLGAAMWFALTHVWFTP